MKPSPGMPLLDYVERALEQFGPVAVIRGLKWNKKGQIIQNDKPGRGRAKLFMSTTHWEIQQKIPAIHSVTNKSYWTMVSEFPSEAQARASLAEMELTRNRRKLRLVKVSSCVLSEH